MITKKRGFSVELTEKEIKKAKGWLGIESDAKLRKILEDTCRDIIRNELWNNGNVILHFGVDTAKGEIRG